MGVCTDMFLNIEFEDADKAHEAHDRLVEFKESEGRSQMRVHDYLTSIQVEDYFDRKPSAEYLAKKLLKLFKGLGVTEVSCDFTQVVDSYYFGDTDEFEEFIDREDE